MTSVLLFLFFSVLSVDNRGNLLVLGQGRKKRIKQADLKNFLLLLDTFAPAAAAEAAAAATNTLAEKNKKQSCLLSKKCTSDAK